MRLRAGSLGCAQGCGRASSVGPGGQTLVALVENLAQYQKQGDAKKTKKKLQDGTDLSKPWQVNGTTFSA